MTSIKRIEIEILKSDINIPLVLPLLLSLPSDNRPEQLALFSVDSQGHPRRSLHPTGQVAADQPCDELENTGQAVPRLQQSFKGTRTVKTEGSAITRTQASASMYRQTHAGSSSLHHVHEVPDSIVEVRKQLGTGGAVVARASSQLVALGLQSREQLPEAEAAVGGDTLSVTAAR